MIYQEIVSTRPLFGLLSSSPRLKQTWRGNWNNDWHFTLLQYTPHLQWSQVTCQDDISSCLHDRIPRYLILSQHSGSPLDWSNVLFKLRTTLTPPHACQKIFLKKTNNSRLCCHSNISSTGRVEVGVPLKGKQRGLYWFLVSNRYYGHIIRK